MLALLICSIVETALTPWSTLAQCVKTYGMGIILETMYIVLPEPMPQVGTRLANVAIYISTIQAIYTYTLRCSPFLPAQGTLLVFAVLADPEDTCPVCLDPLHPCHKRCACTPCGHWFHDICLRRWCQVSPSCPLCRQGLVRL